MTASPKNSSLAKFDEDNAYIIIVPIHSEDGYLLDMQWWDKLYIDLAFPLNCALL